MTVPSLVHGQQRVPLVVGRTLFDAADDLEMLVPASCRRSGRCRECVVEIHSGEAALCAAEPEESYLPRGFRLACRARIERLPDEDLEFAAVRRRLRIFAAPPGPPLEVDPVVEVVDGRVRYDGVDVDRSPSRLLGIALDVGTTTVVLELVDLTTGEALAGAAFENPQRFGGSDVVARIAYETDHPGELRQALRRALNHELASLYGELGVDRRAVFEVVVVGNAAMRDLFFALDVAPIGRSPFRSTTEVAWREGRAADTSVVALAHQLGILVHPRARIWGAPLIACHVGADAAADLVATGAAGTGADDGPGPTMLIDIGTNTEIILGDGRRIVAASSPAGPAFEGGAIRHGMAASDGAIEAVHHDDLGWTVRTIGDAEPVGICGSGLVDLLAELRRIGAMTVDGAFADDRRAVDIVPERGICLTRFDISELAQAKAANTVGYTALLRTLGLTVADLGRVHLAGGFASSLNVESAMAIGLLPRVALDRVIVHGNASVRGAKALLLSRGERQRLVELVGRIRHMELEAEPDFFDLFVEGLRFEPFPDRSGSARREFVAKGEAGIGVLTGE